jgi:hypothetical protein
MQRITDKITALGVSDADRGSGTIGGGLID